MLKNGEVYIQKNNASISHFPLANLSSKEQKEIINVPLKSMINVANKTVKNFVSSLDESERKELKKILSTPKETLVEDYNSQKESVISKLSEQKDNENDKEVVNTIEEVLNKLQTESFSELNYFKLKQLNEGL